MNDGTTYPKPGAGTPGSARLLWSSFAPFPYRIGLASANARGPLSLFALDGAGAPRCLARARSGEECQSPAVKGRKRCRMHGGTNPGAPGGNRNAWKHGERSADAVPEARTLSDVLRLVRVPTRC